jgi:hypothetical protein
MTREEKHIRTGRVLTSPVTFKQKTAVTQASRLAGTVELEQKSMVTRSRPWDEAVQVHGHSFDPVLSLKQVRFTVDGLVSANTWAKTGGSSRVECINNGVPTPMDNQWLTAWQENELARFTMEDMPVGFQYAVDIHAEVRTRFMMSFGAPWVAFRIKAIDTLGASTIYSKQEIFSHSLPPHNFIMNTVPTALTKPNMDSLELELWSENAGGWGFAAGIVQVIEIDLVVNYMGI